MSKHSRSTTGLYVEVRNGNVDQAMRKLKKKISNDGMMMEYRDKQEFVPNFEKKKKAKAAAKSRWRKFCAKRDSM